jgi:hypothetical protein
MYAPPPADNAAAPSRTGILGIGPILAIACLLFLLLVIASVIILSLIPVYTPRKSASSTSTSAKYYIILNYSGTLSSDGTLSQSALNSIATSIQQAAGLPVGSVIVISGSASSRSTSGKRKRRASQISRSRRGLSANGLFFQQIYLIIQFNSVVCPSCTSIVGSRLQNLSFSTTIIFLGITYPLSCTIQSIGRTVVSVPPFLLTTTTAAVTANG